MIWDTKTLVQSFKMESKMWSLDDVPELKTCRLCAAITDDSVELKDDMKNFLVHFLEIEDLPQKICVTCFQDCCDAKRFKERCRKAFEKLSKLERILPKSFMLGMPINHEGRTNLESQGNDSLKSNNSETSEDLGDDNSSRAPRVKVKTENDNLKMGA